MPAVARKDGVDQVNTVHNAIGSECKDAPTITATNAGSGDVFAENIGVVRLGDAVQAHTFPGCSTHQPGLVVGSGTVFVNNQACGRLGDTYGCGAEIISGAGTVFADG